MSAVQAVDPGARLPAQAFLETLPLAVYVCHSPSGEILRFNQAARELWGDAPTPGTKLCGAMRLFLPDGTPLPKEECPMAFAVREGKSYADQYVLMQRVDGERFIANVNIAPIHDGEGRLVGAINAFQDVTARRRSEMLLEAERRLLERIVAGDAPQEVLADAARAAERFTLARARALVYLVQESRLRLLAAPSLPGDALAGIAELTLPQGAPPEQALPARLASGEGLRLARAVPVLDARGEPRGLFALYEPRDGRNQALRYEGLELLARTAALALEREALVAEARENAEHFRLLLEGLPAAAYTCDPQGRITYSNRRAAELWGRSPRLDDSPELRECMARALREGTRHEGREVTIERPDGQRATALAYAMPFRDEKGELTGAVNVLVDISERKAAESTLRASEARMRAILDTTPECVKLVAPDGALLQMNAAGLGMVGASSAADVVGRCVYDLIAPEDRAAFVAFNERICRGERGVLEFDVVGLGGKRRHMETHATPFALADGTLAQLAITRDVTERRRTEAERERFAAALAESDRRKDEFIATLSHELRNPLAPLRTSVELLGQAAQRDPASVARLQEVMARQVEHLVRLVDDLLETARITRGTFELRRERLALAGVVRQALETSSAAIEAARHQLSLELPAEPLWVEGDAVRLVQIVSNLLNNAAKYTDPNGRILVRVRREGGEAAVLVRDNGIGIAPEMAPRLFEMFARSDYTDPRGKSGLGVGLALARRLTEMHGGRLEARSEGPGKGSEFELRLPLAKAGEPAAVPAAQPSAGTPGRRVLVVDDNRDAADTLAMLLRASGIEARTAHDGAQALELLETFSPDVALLDIGMPQMDGYELARAIRARRRDPIVLVALTGWGQPHDRSRAFAAGFDHHLVKPATIEQLMPIVGAR